MITLMQFITDKTTRRWSVRAGLVLVLCLVATMTSQADQAGRLVIVGGALNPENATVYEAFLAGPHGEARIGVVPLASGVPERSGPLTVQDIQQYAPEKKTVFDTKLTSKRTALIASSEGAGLLADCHALWFTGGDQSRIISAMRPATGDTPSYKSVLSVLKKGGTVGGTSAGAAMMSDPMIRGGNSQDAMLLGVTTQDDEQGVWVGQGMGLFEYGMIDQHFLRRGRFGRLLATLEATETTAGFGISENRAIQVDRATAEITTVGKRALTLIDRRDATRDGFERQNIRIHLLGHGDTVDGKSLAVKIADNKSEITTPPRDTGEAISFYDVWDPYVIADMITALATNPTQSVISYDRNYEYRMSSDKRTKFYIGTSEALGLSAVGVRLDIVPRGDLKKSATERREQLTKAGNE